VWNKEQDFDFFCNMEMVELSLVDNASDREELKSLITNHLRHTGSPLAQRLLGDWENVAGQFIMVMPIEYKKFLIDQKAAALKARIEEVGLLNE
jgi:glutamate synthase (NADPH/NADH) large chain